MHQEDSRSWFVERTDRLVFWGLCLTLFGTPLILSRFNASGYGLTKATFLRVLTLALLTAWTLKVVSLRKISLVRTPLDTGVALFAVAAVLSTIFSSYFAVSLWGRYREHQGLLTLINYVLVFFLVTNFVRKKSDFQKVFLFLVASAALISFYAILQHFGIDFLSYQQAPYQEMRSWSTLGNPIFLGGYLALVIPFVFASLLLDERRIPGRLLLVGVLALLLVALVFTLTRASWLGALFGLLLVVAFSLPELKKHQAGLLWVGIATLVLLFIILVVGAMNAEPSLSQRFLSIFSLSSEGGRIKLWGSILPLLLRKPLLGSGPDTFYIVSALGGSGGVHNEFLNTAVTLGFGGLGALLFIFSSLALSMGSRVRSGEIQNKQLLIGIFGSLAAYLIHLQFSFSSIGGNLPFWFLLGLAGAALRNPASAIEINLRLRATRTLFALLFVAAILVAVAAFTRAFMADVYFARAAVYEKEGMLEKSLQTNAAAVRLNPSEETYLTEIGQRYVYLSERESSKRSSHLEAAQGFFRQALVLNPNSEEARLGLGEVLVSEGRIKEAFGQWNAALAFDPNQYDAYWYMGQTYESLGLIGKAREAYLSVLKLNPEDRDAQAALSRLQNKR